MKKVKKKYIIISISAIVLIAIVCVVIYLITPYKTEEKALLILTENPNVSKQSDIITITNGEKNSTGIIFYPGAKVEGNAYLPLFERVTELTGATCFLVDMPFNLAVLNQNVASEIIEQNADIENWYIAGHSLGGGMASDFASNNEEIIDGLIVLGAYVYGDYPIEKSLTIYGTLNPTVAEDIDYTENVVVIEGGNHAQFGNYGKQPGDLEATISNDEQQEITAVAISDFLKNNKN